MLMALGPNGRISAERAERGSPFRCPQCEASLVLKRGRFVVAHFSHRRASACVWASGETAEHLAAKRGIAAAFAARGVSVELEADVLSVAGDRRADVLLRHPSNDAQVAIEVQHSPLDLRSIERRTRAYLAAGVSVVWIGTLDRAKIAFRHVGRRVFVSDRYAAPAWQRYAAEYHGGLWFWTEGALWRGWLKPAWISRPRVFDPEMDAFCISRRWTTLTIEGPYAAEMVRVERFSRPSEVGEDFNLPAGIAARLVLRGQRGVTPSPTIARWTDRDGQAAFRTERRVTA